MLPIIRYSSQLLAELHSASAVGPEFHYSGVGRTSRTQPQARHTMVTIHTR